MLIIELKMPENNRQNICGSSVNDYTQFHSIILCGSILTLFFSATAIYASNVCLHPGFQTPLYCGSIAGATASAFSTVCCLGEYAYYRFSPNTDIDQLDMVMESSCLASNTSFKCFV